MSEYNRVVFGNDKEGLVHVEVWGNTIYEFWQQSNGTVNCNMVNDYHGWYLTHSKKGNLNGKNHFNTLNRMKKFSDMRDLYDNRVNNDDFLLISDKASMYMIDTELTLFKGLDFDDVHKVGFDIETTGIDPLVDSVKMISIVDNRGYSKVLYDEDECRLIRRFINVIQKLDPSILLHYNGYNFDIPFLITRATKYGIILNIGRQVLGKELDPIEYNMTVKTVKGQHKTVKAFRVFGRACIDLYHSTIKYDYTERSLNNYQLKNVISQYGLEKDDRVHMSFNDIISALTGDDPVAKKECLEYCRADSEDLINLDRHICQAEFYLSQMIPMNYDKLMYKGAVGRFNAIMIRDYLQNMESIPMFDDDFYKFDGAKVEANETGIFHHVGDVDVKSMYPTLMLNNNIFPRMDTINTQKRILDYMRTYRFKLQKEMKVETDPIIKKRKDGLQSAFKIAINSNFGILTSGGFYWRDNEQGASVTRHGRELIIKIRDFLISYGLTIVALDTDGISYSKNEPIDIDYINNKIKEILPEGVEIESKTYKGMVVYMKKNYSALTMDDKIINKGSALTSSSAAPCIKKYLKLIVELLLNHDYENIKIAYNALIYNISNNKFPITEFNAINRVNRTVKDYQNIKNEYNEKGQTYPSQWLYELAIKTGVDLRIGDKVATYQSKTYIDKKPNTRIQKKLSEMSTMDTLFSVESTPILIEQSQPKWIDDYDESNPDISIKYYIDALNNKVYDILLKHLNKRGELVGVLEPKIWESIFGDSFENTNDYKYVDIWYPESKEWNRITVEDSEELIYNNGKENGKDIFITIQKWRNPEHIDGEYSFHPIYFDIDASDLSDALYDTKCIYNYFKNVLKLDKDNIMIWFSGSKGFHIEVNNIPFGYKPKSNLHLVNKEIANTFIKDNGMDYIDTGTIYSKRRQWRLPFSINSKSGLRKIPIYDINEYNNIDDLMVYVNANQEFDSVYNTYMTHMNRIKNKHNGVILELKDWYNGFVQKLYNKQNLLIIKKPKWQYERLKGKNPKCINFLLKNSIFRSGDRNRATLTLLSFYKELGYDMNQAIDIVVNWTLEIPEHLTSIKGEHKILENVRSVARTVYNSNEYIFDCNYIKSLLYKQNFECPSVCELK